jgi:hypothetical protein
VHATTKMQRNESHVIVLLLEKVGPHKPKVGTALQHVVDDLALVTAEPHLSASHACELAKVQGMGLTLLRFLGGGAMPDSKQHKKDSGECTNDCSKRKRQGEICRGSKKEVEK